MHAVDPGNAAMVRLGALLACSPSAAALQRAVSDAQLAGISPDEMVRCVVNLVPTLGVARTSSVVSNLALSLGFDVDAALEEPRPSRYSISSTAQR